MCELGERLRDEREQKGISLKALAKALNIKHGFLEAIEACRLEGLPEPVLVRGYIRSYAQALGLDPEPFLALCPIQPIVHKQPAVRQPVGWLLLLVLLLLVGGVFWYRSALGPAKTMVVVPPPPSAQVVSAAGALPALPEVVLGITTEPSGAEVYLDNFDLGPAPVSLTVMGGERTLKISKAGYQTYQQQINLDFGQKLSITLKPVSKPVTPSATAPSVTTPAAITPSVAIAQATQEVVGPASQTTLGNLLVLRFSARCWLRVTAGSGRVLFTGIQNAGDTQYYPLPVTVQVGNAGVVRVELNGKNQGPMGKLGEVVERTYTAL